MPHSGTSWLVLNSILVFVVLAVCLGSPPGVHPFLPPIDVRRNFLTPLHSPPPPHPQSPHGAVVMFILGLVECAPSSGVMLRSLVCWFHHQVATLVHKQVSSKKRWPGQVCHECTRINTLLWPSGQGGGLKFSIDLKPTGETRAGSNPAGSSCFFLKSFCLMARAGNSLP